MSLARFRVVRPVRVLVSARPRVRAGNARRAYRVVDASAWVAESAQLVCPLGERLEHVGEKLLADHAELVHIDTEALQ